MCKKTVCLIVFFLVLAVSGAAQGTVYYVSPSGSDSNPGTSPEQAWASTDKVNSMTFSAGDSILFEGGQTFSGGLVFTSIGTPTSPIVISSYGTGRATINSDYQEKGFNGQNAAGLEIRDLIFLGSGNDYNTTNAFNGIHLEATGSATLEYIRIDNVEVAEYVDWGIVLWGSDSFGGFRDVEITNTEVHDIGKEGINSRTAWPVTSRSHFNIYIADCVVYNVSALPTSATQTGSGIVLGGVDGGLIEYCEAYNCGSLNAASGGGPVGIWCWESENFVIQYCESHHNRTMAGDGGGFDMDGGTSYSTTQYNYSHDNDGAGVLIMQFDRSSYAGDNVCRYNICANDSRGHEMGILDLYSGASLSNIEIYNNIFYAGPDSQLSSVRTYTYGGSFSNVNIRNNLLIAEPDQTIFNSWAGTYTVIFQGNVYWQMGSPLKFIYNQTDLYTGLDWWRTQGQETLNSSPVGYEFDPKLADIYDHPIVGPRNLDSLTSYKLTSSSPAIDRGLDLEAEFGIDPGTRDYYGTSIPQGSSFDLGHDEYPGGGQVAIPDPPAPDSTPPSPDPMTFATAPYTTGLGTVAMEATTASDAAELVQYYFTCTSGAGGHDSGWQYSTFYEDNTLSPGTTYSYTVKARDVSLNMNETAESSAESATTNSYGGSIIFSDGFESGDFIAGGWEADSTPDGYIYVSSKDAYTGTYGAHMTRHSYLAKYISTEGLANIRIRYAREFPTNGIAAIMWWDGDESHPIEKLDIPSGSTDPWTVVDIMCGPEADNNPDFGFIVMVQTNHKNDFFRVDDVEIWGESGGPDVTPPSPDPMTFASAPAATGDSSIEMTATTASDPSGVEYYFTCVSGGGNDSGWQDSTYYEDMGLSSGTEYCYTVKARDKSVNQNETGVSGSACATTTQPDLTPPSPDPMTFASAPAATGDSSIEMTATTAVDDQYGVEYYFDCVSGGGHDSGWQSSTYYEDTGLSSGTEYCYTVKARDTSPNQNETAASGSACATTTQPDLTPPEPDPMTFATVPYATGTNSIAMVATTASDESGVEYYFSCVSGGGNDSGWQDETFYEDSGLLEATQYCYTVKARDKSANQNETAASSSACATTETDTTPPSPDPMTFATAPYATGSSSIAMVATTATDDSGVEYYFTCVSGGGNDSGWQDNTAYEDIGLDPNTEYCYTVKARDKSPSQNETAASSSACATTEPISGGPQIFWDGFESGGFSEGGWTATGSCAVHLDGGAYEGTYLVYMKYDGSMETSISTSGYSGIHLKYAGYTNGFDAGEYIIAEWYDGSDWQPADQLISEGSWTARDIALPSGAANNPNFKIRIRTNTNKNTEWAHVDAVEVTGSQ